MSEFARVDSVEALKAFRIALCKFAETVRIGLSEAESELHRTAIWLRQDQQTYWKGQVQKRRELVTRAKIALAQKRDQKTPLGGRYSCVDEERALAAAVRRFEEAEQKLANVRRWMRQLDEEAFNYKGVTQGLQEAVDHGIPVALAQLDTMLEALGAYLSLVTPVSESVSPATAPESAARPGEAPPDGGEGSSPGIPPAEAGMAPPEEENRRSQG